MITSIHPVSRLRGKVVLPASKSYSIRAFLIAACGGVSRIVAPSDCDDAQVALNVARQLGAKVHRLDARTWSLTVAGKKNVSGRFDVRESGTVLRFLLPLLPWVCSRARVSGRGTLRGRPNTHLIRTLQACGMKIRGQGPLESIPIVFSGGCLRGGRVSIPGDLSSQFISALLIAFPKLAEDTRLHIQGKTIVSSDYVTMTRQVLALSGVRSDKVSAREYRIKGGQTFRGLKCFHVPSDYGLAAFLLGAGALLPSALVLNGHFAKQLLQADGRIIALLRKMGASFSQTRSALRINGPCRLRGGNFSLQSCPDLVPIMAVLALFARGRTQLSDIRHARAKESDRLSDLRKELLKVGAKIKETGNALTIFPQEKYRGGVLLDPHHDHRLAMAFAVLGLKVGVKIKDIDCVAKSYRGFLRDLRAIGAKVTLMP